MNRSLWVLIVVVFSSVLCLGQASSSAATKTTSASSAHPKGAPEPWLVAAEQFHADALGLEATMPGRLHAVLLARLCAQWWKTDVALARPLCARALDELTAVGMDETSAERDDRINHTSVVLRIIGPFDESMRNQLLNAMALPPSGPAQTTASDYHATALGLAQLDAARQRDQEPAQMSLLIQQALQQGVGGRAVRALLKLRQKSPESADRIFEQEINLATQASDLGFIESWAHTMNATYNKSPLPEAWRVAIADSIATRLASQTLSEADRPMVCMRLGSYLQPINSFPANTQSLIQAAFAACASGPQLDLPQFPKLPVGISSSDGWLHEANAATDPRVSQLMKYNAATVAATKEKDFEKAVHILDDMADEEKSVQKYSYFSANGQRQQWAIQAAVEACSHGEVKRALGIIDGSPGALRLNMDIAIARKIAEKKLPGLSEILAHTLSSMTSYRSDVPTDYVNIVNLYAAERPTEAANILRLAMAELDAWRESQSTHRNLKPGEQWFEPLDRWLAPLPFSSDLLVIGPETLQTIGTTFHSGTMRASYDLALFTQCVGQHRRASQTASKTSALALPRANSAN
jgi:hypothetical protein